MPVFFEAFELAGADVPRPLAHYGNAILMEFVGDETGAAPLLQHCDLAPAQGERTLQTIMANVELFLRMDRIHGDLSAYNVLYWQGDIRVIDLPQCVDAIRHPNAFMLFARDVDRMCRYFEKQGLSVAPGALACRLWEDWIG